jgi:purine-nucleoside phosphorylase
MINKINETVQYLRTNGFNDASVGIILGTGLGRLVDEIVVEAKADYDTIPHFPLATVEFHGGTLIFGKINGVNTIVLHGRFHLYEGYNLQEVTYPVRILQKLGVKTLIVSNAAGAVNLDFKKGDLMLIEDHINLQGGSPLAFHGAKDLGQIFVDMREPYSKALRDKIKAVANNQSVSLQEGVYASVVGPQLETRAEYRMIKMIGADAVGMSTVPEVIVAKQLEMDVLAISILTDECDPENLQPIDIPEILAVVAKSEPKLIGLVKELLPTL